jgi:PAS domain S-box-containing protein
MAQKDDRNGVAAELRRKAEELARAGAVPSSEGLASPDSPESLEALSPEAARKTIHELRVHQIELEMQNEELRRAQVELDAAKVRYFDLYDLAPVGYCTLNERGVILEANLTAATLLGLARGALVRQTISRFILKDDQDFYYLLRKQLFETAAPQATELRMAKQDGTLFWAHLAATAAEDEDGVPVARLVLHDITERKRAEAELRESEEQHRAILETALDGFSMANPQGRFLQVNEAFCRMTGYSAQELLAMSIPDLEASVSAVDISSSVGNIMEQGQSRFESRHRRKDGSVFDVEVSVQHRPDEGGRLVAFLRDITERKRADRELQESRQLVESVLENVPLMVFLKEAEGLRFVMFNRAGEDLLGYARKDLLGKSDLDLFPPEQAAFFMAKDREVLAGDLLLDIPEEPIQTAKKGTRLLHTRKVCVKGADGLTKYLLGISEDITESKQGEAARAALEEQLRESHKMEAIGTLAGGIAHDFNNVLATILGNAELARQDLSASPLALVSIEEIRKAGARARDLVQQILSFSRRQPTERKPTALAPVVREAVRLLRATLPARLVLEVHCETEVPAALADANQVKQVLINLASNAMQAIRGGPGHIAIRLDTVMLDAALAGSHPALGAMHARCPGPVVRLAVTDDGDGMDPATLGKAFEPFFTTRAVNEGTGLGLSVVHGIVEGHDGAIVVESEPGKGSTFTVYLPAADAGDAGKGREAQAGAPGVGKGAVATAAEPGSVGAGGGQHILYVDDDESLVFLVDRLLKRRGFRVSTFTNQRAALEALRADPARFDLVVTDYNMPGMSGLDVAREVRAIRADLPVAVATGFVDEALRALAAAAGVRELVFKADAAEDLCDSLARMARSTGKTAFCGNDRYDDRFRL